MSDIVDQDDIDLNYAREKRRAIVEVLCSDGKVPTDPEAQATMLKALSDMSKDAIAKKRIKSDEKIAKGNTENTALVASLLSQFNPAMILNNQNKQTTIKPEVELQKPDLVPGETDINPPTENFETFTARMGMG